MRSWKRECTLLAAVLLAACQAPAPPEQRVRAFVAKLEQLTEQREFTALVDVIAADYLDTHGNDRLKAVALLRAFYLRNRSVHLLTRVDAVRIHSEARAAATVYVALGRRAFDANTALPDADVFRVDIELAADGDGFEILQTQWQRASAADVVF